MAVHINEYQGGAMTCLKMEEKKKSSQLLDYFIRPLSFHLQHSTDKKKMLESKKFCHVHLEDQDHDKIKLFLQKRCKSH